MSSIPRSDRRENVRLAVLKIAALLEAQLPAYALKRRDPREPGRREKEQAEERLAAVVRRILRKQKAAVRARLEAQYPDRKATIPPNYEDYNWAAIDSGEDDEDITALILVLLLAVRGGIAIFGNKHPIIDYSPTSVAAAKWARDYGYQLINGINDTTRKAVSEAVATFAETPGFRIGDLMSQLSPMFGDERAQKIAVTETTRAFAEGQMQAGRDLLRERPGLKLTKTWFTEQDEKVCDVCLPLDGITIEFYDGFGVESGEAGLMEPPAHVNCRCWIETSTEPAE